ncbi:OmpP1/FadL family transporter [Labilithrix luteola]|uniref:OmpP1/FadL family transporter n=1 Tax=Labilithrix luteola TaxID=1391654 RepID=UPI0011BA6408|nr:outer membrane protein transport protein [Labilithrix luteola]
MAIAGAGVARPRSAMAGGLDIPDHGTQALGRGGAFVAKADDGTAIYYNPAGLARQRGTKLLANANVYLSSFSFQRAGRFPGDGADGDTPWAGSPFPKVANEGGASVAPFAALSSDFGTFDRFTAAVGIFGRPSVGNRTFPFGVDNAPSAARYDFVQSRTSYLYPTVSAAYRVAPWLDLGVSGHLVLASIGRTWMSSIDAGQCTSHEYQPCDGRANLDVSGSSFGATVGALIRADENLAFGLTFQTPASIDASGTMTVGAPEKFDGKVGQGAATVATKLPWTARAGARYVEMAGDFEVYDLELDVTYEAWNGALGDGMRLSVPAVGSLQRIDNFIVQGYRDTYGIRGGGTWNFDALGGVMSARAGAYFDSAATRFEYTRIDNDTLAKIAGTIGFGYKKGAFGFDVAYAAIASIPRLVGDGAGLVRPLNLAENGRAVDGSGVVVGAINEGAYRGFTHLLSFGVSVTFDAFFGPGRANELPLWEGGPSGSLPHEEAAPAEPSESQEGTKSDDDKKDDVKKPEEPKKNLEVPPEQPKKKDEKKDDEKKGNKPQNKKEWWEGLD